MDAIPDFIDVNISRQCGITSYGLYGMEVQRNHRQAAKFNEFQPGKDMIEDEARLANWQAAVRWCLNNPKTAPAIEE